MYISKVEIKNFRIFDETGIVIYLNKGVNAIISENNCGKSAVIDVLRLAFSTIPYKKDIYFNTSDFHVGPDGKRSNEAFISVYFNELSPDLFEIWNPEEGQKGEFHIRYYTVSTQEGQEKVRYSIWGGPIEGNIISAETFEAIQVVFLGALRDAETEMRPARSSKLASLFSAVTSTDEAKEEVTNILRNANSEILQNESLTRVKDIVNDNLSTIEQDVLKQRIGLGLVEPRFDSIAASIRAWLKPRWFYVSKTEPQYSSLKAAYTETEWRMHVNEDKDGAYLDIGMLLSLNKLMPNEARRFLLELDNKSFDLRQNGLGYNNLLFMSAVLGDMKTSSESSLFNLLLVEEPEAHLHPQLQELIHNYFERNVEKENFQVIYTSHSPTLVSRIGLDKITLLFEEQHRINCISLSQSNLNGDDRDNLERYLDVTKSQMLFAKGIIFVEGISEALLLPIFAEYLNRPFDKYAISVVNVDGVSFKPFADLLCYANKTHQRTIKAAIITDDDRCTEKTNNATYISKEIDYDTDSLIEVIDKLKSETGSARYQIIKKLCEDAHINIYGARKTFEYELALEPSNTQFLLDAIIKTQPLAGNTLSTLVNRLSTQEEKAACIWLYISNRSRIKGEVSQNLSRSLKIELNNIRHSQGKELEAAKLFTIPQYIKDAIFSVTEALQ